MKVQIEFIKGFCLGVEYIEEIDVYDNGDPIDLIRINLFILCIYIGLE